MDSINSLTRRRFIKQASIATSGVFAAPYLNFGKIGVSQPMKRSFGRIGFNVTTLGLGGQASIQWTPDDVDPVSIILKAYHAGVNYYDTSNVYGPSQNNFGKAFRALELVPGLPGYKQSRRESIFLTSKTGIRWTKGGEDQPGGKGFSNGPRVSAVADVKRSLTQMFGDGNGSYPKGAYIDMVLIHALGNENQIDGVRTGLDQTDATAEHIGALAGLRDLRDGTNLTGLNPKEEKLIRHIGFSGHRSPSVMMEMIRRDTDNLLDGMLIAINANDRLYANMQYNAIPVAKAKNMGVIAMKVFSDGAMYSKEARFSNVPSDVVRTVGEDRLPSRPLVQYSLSTPGVCTAIIGTGQISDDSRHCQLTQNMSAAQIQEGSVSESDRRKIELLSKPVKGGRTNYFQQDFEGLTTVGNLQRSDSREGVSLRWDTSVAGNEPIVRYEVFCNERKVGEVKHQPQTSINPFKFSFKPSVDNCSCKVATVDREGNRVMSEVV